MQLNGVIFPAPECSYSIKDFPQELMFIPKIIENARPHTLGQNTQRNKYSSLDTKGFKHNSNSLSYGGEQNHKLTCLKMDNFDH